MRIEIRTPGAMSRGERLRALVRAHQGVVEHRSQLTRMGAPTDPQVERDLAAIGERISDLLSNGGESDPTPTPTRLPREAA